MGSGSGETGAGRERYPRISVSGGDGPAPANPHGQPEPHGARRTLRAFGLGAVVAD